MTERKEATIPVDLCDLINNDIEWLDDMVSEKMTGSICGLQEITFEVVGMQDANTILIKVSGFLTEDDDYV